MRLILNALIPLVFLPTLCLAQVLQYDTAGRLSTATYSDGSSISYEYDISSNITRINYSTAPAVPPEGVIDTPAGNVGIEAGQSVNFSGTGSDPDGATPLTYLWTFDGAAADSTAEDPGAVTFATAGTYTVTFTVTDATGLSDPTPATVTVTVTNPAPPPGGGSGSSGGGATFLLLPFLLALVALRGPRRLGLVAMLLLAGAANAQTWTEMDSGTTANLNDVWMASATLAYAVGDGGTALRFDGTTWTPVDLGTAENLNAVWGTGPDDVWVVGASGTVIHFDGSAWSPVDIGAGTLPLNDVWTAGPGQIVYVAGSRGIWRFENGSWIRQSVKVSNTQATTNPLFNMSAIRGSDNYIVTTANSRFGLNEGLFVNFDWVGLSTFDHNAVWVYDDTFMLAVGETSRLMDGGDPEGRSSADWQDYATGVVGNAVWGTSPSSIWVAGSVSTSTRINYYDGNPDDTWTPQLTVSFREFRGLHGVNDQNLIAVGTLGIIYGMFAEPPPPTSANFIFSHTDPGGVNTYTGEKTHSEIDFVLPGDLTLVFERYYGSLLSAQGSPEEPMGRNWSHSFNWWLDDTAGPGQRRIVDPRGREYLFTDTGTGYEQTSPGWANTGLIEAGGEVFFYDRETGLSRAFEPASGRLTRIEDRNGNYLAVNYTAGRMTGVSDSVGELIALTYDPDDRLVAATVAADPTFARIYGYDGSNLLVSTTSPRNTMTNYAYDANDNLTGVTRGAGTADETIPRTWAYDDRKRVIEERQANGGLHTYSYDDISRTTTVMQPDGLEKTHVHDASGNLVESRSALGRTTAYAYDSLDRRISVTDPDGRTTRRAYDPLTGRMTEIVEPGGFTTSFDYVSVTTARGEIFHDRSRVIWADGGAVVLQTDARGNVLSHVDAVGNETLFEHDARGNLVRKTTAAGGVETFAYNPRNLLASRTDAGGNTTVYSYDALGRRTSATDPLGTTEAVYSSRGRPDQVRSRTGAVLDYAYDSLDRVTRTTRSDGVFQARTYDERGNLGTVNYSGNVLVNLAYNDQNRLAAVTHNGNHTTRYGYDADGRFVQLDDPDNRAWQIRYPGAVSIVEVVRPDNVTVEMRYDGDPRELVSAIGLGTSTWGFAYDEVGRPREVRGPFGRETGIRRNLRGDWQEITDQPTGARRAYQIDAFGNVVTYTNPLGGENTRGYGNDDYYDTETDAAGNTREYDRDAGNRIVQIHDPDSLVIDVAYGSNDLPTQWAGSDGTAYDLDSTPEGDIVGGTNLVLSHSGSQKIIDSNGIQVSYDGDDRVQRMTFAPGIYVEYEYNGRGDVVRITDSLGGETVITWTALGSIDTITLPNALQTSYSYNAAIQITAIDIDGFGGIAIDRGANSRILSITSDLLVPQGFAESDRSYGYDVASRITSAIYDVRGNQLDNGTLSRRYDAFSRLIESGSGANTSTYEYDVLGQVVREASAGGARQFVINYALAAPRISIERDASGNDAWYYVHTIGGRLLYRLNASGQRQYYHFDHDGNTAMITDDPGNVLNAYSYAPHGEVLNRTETVNNDYTTAAEFGGRELDDAGTLHIGANYLDTGSGHFLNEGSFEQQASVHLGTSGAPPNAGRSVTPGDTAGMLRESADSTVFSLKVNLNAFIADRYIDDKINFPGAVAPARRCGCGDASGFGFDMGFGSREPCFDELWSRDLELTRSSIDDDAGFDYMRRSLFEPSYPFTASAAEERRREQLLYPPDAERPNDEICTFVEDLFDVPAPERNPGNGRPAGTEVLPPAPRPAPVDSILKDVPSSVVIL